MTERILPPDIDTRHPTEEECGDFFVKRALKALGIASQKDILNYMNTTDKRTLADCLNAAIETGDIIRLKIQDRKEDFFALSVTMETVDKLPELVPKVYILSPFDNFNFSRNRLKNLFDFDYTLECYVPAAKRTFGYFALPVLYGDSLIGKIDAKADRQNQQLFIYNIIFDRFTGDLEEMHKSLAGALYEFARFNGCNQIRLLKTNSDISFALEKFTER